MTSTRWARVTILMLAVAVLALSITTGILAWAVHNNSEQLSRISHTAVVARK